MCLTQILDRFELSSISAIGVKSLHSFMVFSQMPQSLDAPFYRFMLIVTNQKLFLIFHADGKCFISHNKEI